METGVCGDDDVPTEQHLVRVRVRVRARPRVSGQWSVVSGQWSVVRVSGQGERVGPTEQYRGVDGADSAATVLLL